MDMGYDALRFWLEVVVLVSVVANTVYTFISNRQKANKSAIDNVAVEVKQLAGRVDKLEVTVHSSPTHEDLGKIYDRMNVVGNKLEKMSGSMEAMITQLTLINEHLMNGGK